MILSSVDISLIYETTVATVTNISETDTITYITSYDETKLEFNVDSETNSFTVRALTNENATYERIRVQASSGDYILITIHTLVNASEPSFEFLDNETTEKQVNGATIEVGRSFYSTNEVINLYDRRFPYIDNTDTIPSVTSNYTYDIIKKLIDVHYPNTAVNTYDIKNCFLAIKDITKSGATELHIPTAPKSYDGTNMYFTKPYYNTIARGMLSQYKPIVNFDFKKLVFVLLFACYEEATNKVAYRYYNELASTDDVKGVMFKVYYNGVELNSSNNNTICFICHDNNGNYFSFLPTTINHNNLYSGDKTQGSTRTHWTLAPYGKQDFHHDAYCAILGHSGIYYPGYAGVGDFSANGLDSDLDFSSNRAFSPSFVNVTRHNIELWLNDFPFLWSTDGVVPANVDETSTNLRLKNAFIDETIFNKIKDITSIKDVATNTTPTPTPTPDNNNYVDETPLKHVFNSSYNNNFNKMFLLNKSDVSNIADKFWGNQEDIKQNSQLMGENPLDTVISLRLYPFDLSEYSTGVALNYYCGNFEIGQYESLNTALSPIINLGSIYIPRYHNNFLDYDEYTDIELFVPFCESKVLSAREYLDSTLNFKMVIDYNTGNCLVMVYQNNILKFTCTGQCGIDIAINGRDNAQYLSNQITGWTNTVNSSINTVSTASQPPSPETALNIASGVTNVFKSSFDNSHMRNSPITSGQTTQTLNLYKPLYPYIIFRYSEPLETELTNYGRTVGYACYYDSTLGTNRGFTVCNNIDISKLKCTAEEKTKILEFLTTGIIL